MAKSRKEELEKQITVLREEVYTIDVEKRKAINRPAVGKYYRCRNIYGSGKEWWLYIAITGMDKDGMLTGWQFEQSSHGHIEISPDEDWYWASEEYLGNKITPKSFYAALDKIIGRINDLRT